MDGNVSKPISLCFLNNIRLLLISSLNIYEKFFHSLNIINFTPVLMPFMCRVSKLQKRHRKNGWYVGALEK